MSVRVARSRELVARGFAAAAVARVMQISRQALYRVPTPRAAPQRRLLTDPVEAAIVAEALANQTDGYRMVCAFVRRRLGVAVAAATVAHPEFGQARPEAAGRQGGAVVRAER